MLKDNEIVFHEYMESMFREILKEMVANKFDLVKLIKIFCEEINNGK